MRPVAYAMILVAPLLALAVYFYFSKRYDHALRQLLANSFLAGIAGIIFLLAAEYLSLILGLSSLRSLNRILFYSFITIGGSSELGKFIMFRYYIIPKKQITRPIDAIAFAVMTSLGFSFISLILFVCNLMSIREYFPPTLYASVIIPANIMFSVIMGFFVGMAKFLKARIVFSLTGLLGAAFFHGIFNFCMLTSDFKLLSLFSFGSTIIVLVLVLKAAFTNPEPSDK